MQAIQLNPEEIREIEFGFNPDNKEEAKTRDEILDNIDKHIAEIYTKLNGAFVDKLEMEIKNKENLHFIRDHIMELALLKDNVELTIKDIRKIDDMLGNFVACLAYLNRNKRPDSFFKKVETIKKSLNKQLKQGIESEKGYTIH